MNSTLGGPGGVVQDRTSTLPPQTLPRLSVGDPLDKVDPRVWDRPRERLQVSRGPTGESTVSFRRPRTSGRDGSWENTVSFRRARTSGRNGPSRVRCLEGRELDGQLFNRDKRSRTSTNRLHFSGNPTGSFVHVLCRDTVHQDPSTSNNARPKPGGF